MIEQLQLHAQTAEVETQVENLDPRMLSSVLISTKVQGEEFTNTKDPHARLLELMQSSPVKALLQATEIFAQRAGLTNQEALQQIILSFKEMDHLWGQILLSEGIAHLSSQYH